jgi:peroxiredoxin
MAVEIVVLMRQKRHLRSLIENPAQRYQTLRPNETVPAFTARDLGGRTQSIAYSAGEPHRLLLWFSASCPSCEDNLIFWEELYTSLQSEGIAILGICTDDPSAAQQLVSDYDLHYPVLVPKRQSIVDAYRTNAVPQTILISPTGTVLGIWPGPLRENQKDDIISILFGLDSLTTEGGDVS